MSRHRALVVLLMACGAFACTLYTPPRLGPARAGLARRYSRAEIAADLDTMFTTFEHVHPEVYAVTSADSLRRARAAFVRSLPDSAARDEFYLGFARLVALIGDGHTSIGSPGEERQEYMKRGGRILPLGFEVDESNAVRVTGAIGGLPSGIRRGDRLLSVNGHNADSLLRVFMLEVSGETAWWKSRIAAQSFGSLLLLHGLVPPHALELQDAEGTRTTVTVVGLAQDSLDAIAARNRAARATQPARPPNFTYRKLEEGTGYIDFYSMAGDIRSFRTRIATAFEQIAHDSVRVLIVDLRNNGGGDSRLGEALLDHFVDKPYRSAAAKEWRASDEYRSFMRTGLHPAIRWLPVQYFISDARKFFGARAGTNVMFAQKPEEHDRAQPRFGGSVCVLIGRGTFSSAMETADAIKAYRLAPLLGEDTGGLPTAFGEVFSFRLPRTGLVASVSSARYLRASGDSTDHGPVRPDVEIHRTAEDLRVGRDPVLERAKHCDELTRQLSAQ